MDDSSADFRSASGCWRLGCWGLASEVCGPGALGSGARLQGSGAEAGGLGPASSAQAACGSGRTTGSGAGAGATGARATGAADARRAPALEPAMSSVERRELPQVNPLHQRHLELVARLRGVADLELGARQQIERAHEIFAREALRPAPSGGRARLRRRFPDRAARVGSILTTIRSRISRASSRQTIRRSKPASTIAPASVERRRRRPRARRSRRCRTARRGR